MESKLKSPRGADLARECQLNQDGQGRYKGTNPLVQENPPELLWLEEEGDYLAPLSFSVRVNEGRGYLFTRGKGLGKMAEFVLGTIEAARWGVNNPPPKDNIHSGKKIYINGKSKQKW